MDARYFAASSLGLWFSGASKPNPAGVLAVVVPQGEVLGESNGVNGRSGEESEATEKKRPISSFTTSDIEHIS